MTSTYATPHAIAQAPAYACAGVRALGTVASMIARKVIVVSRSPAQGPPALH